MRREGRGWTGVSEGPAPAAELALAGRAPSWRSAAGWPPSASSRVMVRFGWTTMRPAVTQVPGDHVGARRHLADGHGDVAGRFAVADDQHVLAPRLLLVVQLGAGQYL